MIYQNNHPRAFLVLIIMLLFHGCNSRKNHSIEIYGAFYAQETLFIEVNGELKFQKKFTKSPMEMCSEDLLHNIDEHTISIHVFSKYKDILRIDTTIHGENINPKYHLLFSSPFIKKNGIMVDSEHLPPIDSSSRIVNYIESDLKLNDIRK